MRPRWWMAAALLTLVLPALAFAQGSSSPVAPMSPEEHRARGSDQTPRAPIPPRGYADDIQAEKAAAAAAAATAVPGPVQIDVSAAALGLPTAMAPNAPALLTSFAGQTFLDSSSAPPDPVIAAGPNSLVALTNGRARIYSKAGAVIATAPLTTFFAPAPGESAFDPKVVFDPQSQRFFAAAVGTGDIFAFCSPGSCLAHYFLAVSTTDSPTTLDTTSWTFYTFDATLDGSTQTSNWADYPQLGLDNNVVVLTSNQFSFGSPSFQTAKIRVLNKAALLASNTSTTFVDFFGSTLSDPGTFFLSFTIQPALHLDVPTDGSFFLVSSSRTFGSCDMIIWNITNTTTTPAITRQIAAQGGSCTSAPDAPQVGNSHLIDTGDTRLLNAVYRNGSLWGAHAIAGGPSGESVVDTARK